MSVDDLGDRMKFYERMEAGRTLIPLLPVYARIDGRSFSKLTKTMLRPYDERMSKLMVATTKWLVQHTNACIGYTQSDEINLAWRQKSFQGEIFFAGKIHKMVSQLAALATVYFNHNLFHDSYRRMLPTFDCRVFNLPTLVEAANVFLWREQDAAKNSIAMAARCLYSDKDLFGKNGAEMQEMLWQKGVNWNDYPDFFKRGTFIQRRVVKRPFTTEELEKLPPKHQAHSNPDLQIERTEYHEIAMPPFGKVTNRPEVLFFGTEPLTEEAQ